MNGVARPVCVAGTQCFSDRQQRALQLLPRLISRLSLTPACHSPRKLAGHLPPPVILVVLAFCMQVCDLGAKERGKARRHLLRCEEVNQLDEATQAIVLRLPHAPPVSIGRRRLDVFRRGKWKNHSGDRSGPALNRDAQGVAVALLCLLLGFTGHSEGGAERPAIMKGAHARGGGGLAAEGET